MHFPYGLIYMCGTRVAERCCTPPAYPHRAHLVVFGAMAFGILEDHKLDNVPGTGLLSGRGSAHVRIDEARELKRGTGKYSHIILIPQPSDDPRDPYVRVELA
ncbi:hypothetical protein LXA43DRAFT_369320 [Ganoderma leucocontextum]|nr:hypothetical protein LXA43DRAFT_369320 [Ganoderma leucocontextum]